MYNDLVNGITPKTISEWIHNVKSILQFYRITDNKRIIETFKALGYKEDDINRVLDKWYHQSFKFYIWLLFKPTLYTSVGFFDHH